MEARYDLFELSSSGFSQWIASAVDLPEARQKMNDLRNPAPGGRYLIRDFYSATVVAHRVSVKLPPA